jgi:hypothetical protein
VLPTTLQCVLVDGDSSSKQLQLIGVDAMQRDSGRSPISMKSPMTVMQALEIRFSSSRTFPGQLCCSITACARRLSPGRLHCTCAKNTALAAEYPPGVPTRTGSVSESSSADSTDLRRTARTTPLAASRKSHPKLRLIGCMVRRRQRVAVVGDRMNLVNAGRNSQEPADTGRKKRTRLPTSSDHCRLVLSTKNSWLLSQAETTTR